MNMELRKTFQFEAAHLLPRLPKSHKCRRLHGHSFKVEIVVAGECDPRLGWVMDYADISRRLQADLGQARPLLPERNPRAGESDQREHRRLDLAEAQAQTAPPDRSRRRRNLHRPLRLSRWGKLTSRSRAGVLVAAPALRVRPGALSRFPSLTCRPSPIGATRYQLPQ